MSGRLRFSTARSCVPCRAAESARAAWLVLACLIALGSLADPRVARAVMIDSFAAPDLGTVFMLTSTPPAGNPTHTAGVNQYPLVISNSTSLSLDDTGLTNVAIGGERKTSINLIGGSLEPVSSVGIVGFDLDHLISGFRVATDGSAPSLATLSYLPGGMSTPMDLTAGGATGIMFQVYSTDEPLAFAVSLSNSNASQVGTYSNTVAPSGLPQSVFVPFSAFTTSSSDPLAASAVNQITFNFNTALTPNIDFVLGSITTVPEPSGILLMGIGVVAVAGLALRRAGKWRRLSIIQFDPSG